MTRHRATSAAVLLLVLSGFSGLASYVGFRTGRVHERNLALDSMGRYGHAPRLEKLLISLREAVGLVKYHSQHQQDKWIAQFVFPGLRTGYFVDVGAGDGVRDSNTKALEDVGWRGLCIDPFPTNMDTRSCRVIKIVELTTTTLGDILAQANAPRFIHYVSIDIEGAELEALMGFPFSQYRVGSFTIEHNWEEPKRRLIRELLESEGYRFVRSLERDDCYVIGTMKSEPSWPDSP
jgi:hypothetical protein